MMHHVPLSLRALLGRLIDYAGMFPPARLPLEEALEAYLRYRRGGDAWILGPFIASIRHLDDLLQYWQQAEAGEPLSLVILLRPEEVVRNFLEQLSTDVTHMARRLEGAGEQLSVPWVEARLPLELLAYEGSHAVADFLAEVSGRLQEHVAISRIFWEVPWGNNWGRRLDTFMDAAVQYGASEGIEVAYKMRCGGEYPEQFPSTEQVATGLVLAREAELAFKATAGLHQPFRYFDETLGVYHHGFLTLFVAAVLARTYRLSIDEVIPILLEEHPEHMVFEEEGLVWQDMQVSTEGIRASRKYFARSFGSCSFEEPVEALRALGLLTPLESETSE